MASERKITANRRNGQLSKGPITETGKRNSSRNSLKHGLFSRELVIQEVDEPLFRELRQELYEQLIADTPLQRIARDRVLACAWRCRLACKMESNRLDAMIENPVVRTATIGEAQEPEPQMVRWFGASRDDMKVGTRILENLRVDILNSGSVSEKWRDALIGCFGPDFYTSLREWCPMSTDAVLLAQHLTTHAKTFNRPLPENKSSTTYVRDPQQERQMLLKLVDLYLGFLAAAKRIADQGTLRESNSVDHINLEFTRYVSGAMHNLEDAVEWFVYLKEKRVMSALGKRTQKGTRFQ